MDGGTILIDGEAELRLRLIRGAEGCYVPLWTSER